MAVPVGVVGEVGGPVQAVNRQHLDEIGEVPAEPVRRWDRGEVVEHFAEHGGGEMPAQVAEDPLPVDLSCIRRDAFVGDVVNVPRQTALLEAAGARGCRTQHGRAMFPPQIELALDFYARGL